MSKFDVSFSDDAVTFVNTRTNKAEKIALIEAMDDATSLRAIRSEQNAAISASAGAVSLLCRILDNPRLDEYRGMVLVSQSIPNELKAAIRELETEYIKPKFIQPLLDKGAKPATAEKQWQDYARGLKEGGSYAVAKGHITKMFAYTGNLPMHNGKLLTVAAIKKLLDNLEKPETEKTGIAGKLVALSLDVEKRASNDIDILGDFSTAISALKSMLATYEGLQREALEALTDAIGNPEHNIQAKSDAIVAAAMATLKTEPALM